MGTGVVDLEVVEVHPEDVGDLREVGSTSTTVITRIVKADMFLKAGGLEVAGVI